MSPSPRISSGAIVVTYARESSAGEHSLDDVVVAPAAAVVPNPDPPTTAVVAVAVDKPTVAASSKATAAARVHEALGLAQAAAAAAEAALPRILGLRGLLTKLFWLDADVCTAAATGLESVE